MFASALTVRALRSGSIILSVFAFGLGGCSTPLVTPQAPSFQSRMGDVADWNALADRTVAHFMARSKGQTATTIYVAPGPSDMPFAAAFRSVLEQKLHEKNFLVMQNAKGATVLRFSVQTFLYAKGNQKLPISYASFWSTLAALSVPLRQIASVDTGIAVAAAAGPIVDILASMADTTQAEVVLTVTETNPDGRYLNYRDGAALPLAMLRASDRPLTISPKI